ncbi:MAG: hypothetical protein JWM65_730 [Sphingomonas bacterium]|nr:hypothetical protein [Sphingomonas bacterium]
MAESERLQRPAGDRVAQAGAVVPAPRLQALGAHLNNGPHVIAQRRLNDRLNLHTPPSPIPTGAPVQRVFTYKTKAYSDGALPKTLPHKTSSSEAERLSRSARDFGTLATTADFTAAVALLTPGEGNLQSPAEIAKAAAIAPYVALLPHLAGEAEGTGGHLLTAMRAKWGTALHIDGTPDDTASWTCEWNLLKDPAKEAVEANFKFATSKYSSMFPAAWSQDDLVAQLTASTEVRRGRELQPSGITVEKSGGTFYPV